MNSYIKKGIFGCVMILIGIVSLAGYNRFEEWWKVHTIEKQIKTIGLMAKSCSFTMTEDEKREIDISDQKIAKKAIERMYRERIEASVVSQESVDFLKQVEAWGDKRGAEFLRRAHDETRERAENLRLEYAAFQKRW